MSTLAEIEAAFQALTSHEQQELFLFLAARLHSNEDFPPPREFSPEQIQEWIVDDEAGMQRFRKGS